MGLGLLCPGQGSQHAQLFAPFAGNARAAPILDAIADCLGVGRGEMMPVLAPHIAIDTNHVAQILVTGCSLAWWEILRDLLPSPTLVTGYSVGEVGAHAIVGTLSAAEAIRLASLRARLMDACVEAPQAMLGVPACPEPLLKRLLSEFPVELAIRNGPNHVVVGGLRYDVEAAARWLETAQMSHRLLNVQVASHTSLMREAVAPFRAALCDAGLRCPVLSILSGCFGSLVNTPAQAAETLSAQLAEPLNWQRCLEMACERGVRCFLEIGPGRALARMASEVFPDIPARSVEDFRSAEGVAGWVMRNCASLK